MGRGAPQSESLGLECARFAADRPRHAALRVRTPGLACCVVGWSPPGGRARSESGLAPCSMLGRPVSIELPQQNREGLWPARPGTGCWTSRRRRRPQRPRRPGRQASRPGSRARGRPEAAGPTRTARPGPRGAAPTARAPGGLQLRRARGWWWWWGVSVACRLGRLERRGARGRARRQLLPTRAAARSRHGIGPERALGDLLAGRVRDRLSSSAPRQCRPGAGWAWVGRAAAAAD